MKPISFKLSLSIAILIAGLFGWTSPLWLNPAYLWESLGTRTLSGLSVGNSNPAQHSLGLDGIIRDLEVEFSFQSSSNKKSILLQIGDNLESLLVVLTEDHRLLVTSFDTNAVLGLGTIRKFVAPNETYRVRLKMKSQRLTASAISRAELEMGQTPQVVDAGWCELKASKITLGALADGSLKFAGAMLLDRITADYFRSNEGFSSLVRMISFAGLLAFVLSLIYLLASARLPPQIVTTEAKVQLLGFIVLIGFSFAVFYHFFRGYYLGHPYPFNSFLFFNNLQFTDYLSVRAEQSQREPYLRVGSYPPLAYFISYPLTHLGDTTLEALLLASFFLASVFWILFSIFRSKLNFLTSATPAFILTFLSYPCLFLIDRGNLDLLVYPASFFGLYHLKKSNSTRSLIGLGLAAAMKITPATYFLIFLRDKKFKLLIGTGLGILIVTFLSASFFKGGALFTLEAMRKNIVEQYAPVPLTDSSAYGSHSPKGLIRVLWYNFFEPVAQDGPQPWHFWFRIFSAIIFLTTVLLVYLRPQMEFWKQILLLTLLPLIAPLFSPDYKLVALLIPIAFFLVADAHEKQSLFYLVAFGLLLIPKNYYRVDFVPVRPFANGVSLDVIVTPIVLIALWMNVVISETRQVFSWRLSWPHKSLNSSTAAMKAEY